MLTERMPILPPRSLVLVDQDADLTIANMKNVLIAHWRGPSDERNGERLANAMRALAKHNPIGLVSLVEPSSAPPDKTQRVYLTRIVCDLPVQAISTVVRGNALRRSFATVILTGMIFLVSNELSTRTQICSNDRDAASWIVNHLAFAPPLEELTRAFGYLQV